MLQHSGSVASITQETHLRRHSWGPCRAASPHSPSPLAGEDLLSSTPLRAAG